MHRTSREPLLSLDTPTAPPYWALLERELIAAQSRACEEFFAKYFDERGYLLCVPRWGGNDGPDDAAENQLNWTILHALGAPDRILELFYKGWEGHLRQYTEARTTEVPLGRDGMYYKEFPTQFDWFHNGEGFSAFFLQGLCEPESHTLVHRSRRYADLYTGEPNYDPRYGVIGSMFNGSRGPLLRKATALDWAGDPIEVEGRFSPLHNERSYGEMLEHFRLYTDVVGDHPLNLGATILPFNAYALTGDAAYRDWLLEYTDAWVERTRANDGIMPSNVGLDGTIGGATDGKWYGGCYGWAFTVPVVPLNGQMSSRPGFHSRAHWGLANAFLATGDARYLDAWRSTIERVNENAKEIDGRKQYPRMHGDDGWYEYAPTPFAHGAFALWYWTHDRSLLDLLPERPRWLAFLEGQDPAYPEQALLADLDELRRRVELMRNDRTAPDMRMSDDMNHINPAVTETLNRMMLGGLPTGREGGALHCRLRYFDPERGRAGLPEDVAALVERFTESEVVVQLVNLSPVHARRVVVQGGAYAEHHLESASLGDQRIAVDGAHVEVALAPGAGGRLTIRMRRYANQPTLSFPWR